MKPNRLSFWVMLLCLSLLWYVPQWQAQGVDDSLGMVTGSPTGTYIVFGQDMARITRTAGLNLLVKESEGSLDNIRRLVSKENAALGIVQSDVLGFLRHPENDAEVSPEMRRVADSLRVIFPFYNEEVHLFARKGIQRIEDLNGKKVVVGTRKSGNWLTATNLLRLLKVTPIERLELSPPQGVSAVLAGEADAMFYVAGKPVQLFTNLDKVQQEPQLADLVKTVHFVPLDDKRLLQEGYIAATIRPEDYHWLEKPINTIAVKAVLISFDFSSRHTPYVRKRCDELAQLSKIIREKLDELRRTGHPKWAEVDLNQDIGPWKRNACLPSNPVAPTTETELRKALERILTGKSSR
jgi:TRAP transporter TAXI family solute receptor